MRKSNILLASTAALALAFAPAAQAQSSAETEATAAVVAGTGMAGGGALTGFAIGGPIGAVIGGMIGASVGAGAVAVSHADGQMVLSETIDLPSSTISYVHTHPAPELTTTADLTIGARVPVGAKIYVIPDDPRYGYAYYRGNPVIVDGNTGLVVWMG